MIGGLLFKKIQQAEMRMHLIKEHWKLVGPNRETEKFILVEIWTPLSIADGWIGDDSFENHYRTLRAVKTLPTTGDEAFTLSQWAGDPVPKSFFQSLLPRPIVNIHYFGQIPEERGLKQRSVFPESAPGDTTCKGSGKSGVALTEMHCEPAVTEATVDPTWSWSDP